MEIREHYAEYQTKPWTPPPMKFEQSENQCAQLEHERSSAIFSDALRLQAEHVLNALLDAVCVLASVTEARDAVSRGLTVLRALENVARLAGLHEPKIAILKMRIEAKEALDEKTQATLAR